MSEKPVKSLIEFRQADDRVMSEKPPLHFRLIVWALRTLFYLSSFVFMGFFAWITHLRDVPSWSGGALLGLCVYIAVYNRIFPDRKIYF